MKVPILMIERLSIRRRRTPAASVRSIFPTASLIEGLNGTTHAGSLSGVACTDDAIAAYLQTGAVPTRTTGRRSDLLCPPVPAPVPAASPATTSPQKSHTLRARALARLRAGIEDAALHG